MENCIFCKIVEGTIPSYKVYEDSNYIAILDTIPAVDGQTIIMPKTHKNSYVFMLRDDELTEMTLVAKMLEKALNVDRVQLIFAGTTVSHLHAKLYPTQQRITIEGKKTTEEMLNQTRDKILNKAKLTT